MWNAAVEYFNKPGISLGDSTRENWINWVGSDVRVCATRTNDNAIYTARVSRIHDRKRFYITHLYAYTCAHINNKDTTYRRTEHYNAAKSRD